MEAERDYGRRVARAAKWGTIKWGAVRGQVALDSALVHLGTTNQPALLAIIKHAPSRFVQEAKTPSLVME